jgi:hypothetical protein
MGAILRKKAMAKNMHFMNSLVAILKRVSKYNFPMVDFG